MKITSEELCKRLQAAINALRWNKEGSGIQYGEPIQLEGFTPKNSDVDPDMEQRHKALSQHYTEALKALDQLEETFWNV